MSSASSANPSYKRRDALDLTTDLTIAEIRARTPEPTRHHPLACNASTKNPSPARSHLSASDARSAPRLPRARSPGTRRPLPSPPHEIENTLRMLGVHPDYIKKARKNAREQFRGCNIDLEGMAEIIYRIKILDNLHLMKQQRQSVFKSSSAMKAALEFMGFSTDQVNRAFKLQSLEQKSQETTQYDLEKTTMSMIGFRDNDREKENKKPCMRTFKYVPKKKVPVAMTSSDSDEKWAENAEDFSLFDHFDLMRECNADFPDLPPKLVITMDEQHKRVRDQRWMLSGIVDELDELFEWLRGGLNQNNGCRLRRLKIEGVNEHMYDEISSDKDGEDHVKQFRKIGWRMHWSASTSLVLEKI